ncbi:nucleotidyl transferase AbiEii/AbiGii toxin family protein [Deinococcus ruber]|uniref:Nucleotidyl transferase AbiEii/AbiGii toxin family protein n=1 Tax=Deinococcus ruber TaxID=1848197 RepID=A0A918FCI7_9DEIO|nr:nucleotidyl transferase AbiEii/AbiGii toxin family protein [Deinococcus ruber]GGR30656.1 hypothetical protein GCM10008957_46750 [Deinococcus ruber]
MKYATSGAFRNALNAHLRQIINTNGGDLARLQRRVAYERFLARIFAHHGSTWVLKGGYSLELRLGGRARSTKDLDFNAPSSSTEPLIEEVRDAADLDLNDHFHFTVAEPQRGELQGPPEGGQRFRVTAYLNGAQAFAVFLVDVGQGDKLTNPPEILSPQVDLTFAGLSQPVLYSYPLPEHFAEKLHAYTRPRPQDSHTRVKDLLDISLLTRDLGLRPSPAVATVVRDVFIRYHSHDLPPPTELREPPPAWRTPFQAMATEIGHDVTDSEAAFHDLVRFMTALLPQGVLGITT